MWRNKKFNIDITKEEVVEALENKVAELKTDEEKLALLEATIKYFIEVSDEDTLASFCLRTLCKLFDTSLVVKAHQNVLEEVA